MTPTAVYPKILLDTPSAKPALGYQKTAAALAVIISQSEPQFAVGIFGGWGSGKTTLMRAIKAELASEPSLVVVDFNAWRFEREPLLLVPLLDTIRASLVQWSAGRAPATREKVRTVAGRIGRVVRALATGLSGEVGVPGAAKVKYDVGKALDSLSSADEPENAQSLYVAAFDELSHAFAQFAAGGVTRVVVFVDDLDRCLPANALDVLESIKLFFDLSGFVFVVGLDEDVVERAVLSTEPRAMR
jgi:predicted KAP-like P-loop ATPase